MCPPGYYQSANGPHGNSCTWTHDVWFDVRYAQVHELPWDHWQIGNNREGTLSVFLTIYTYLLYMYCI